MKKFVMGNEAIALGAIRAGVNLVSGYPGTPSTEILETVAKETAKNGQNIHVEWSVNEKAALEVAAGASYAGARTMVTMKQVGLNVASDPLMSLAYIGVKGGMVIVSADDPGPISSQTEQDTRVFAKFSKLPVFDPSSPEEAYEMIGEAFELSEKYGTPVLFRPTTRICHGCVSLDIDEKICENKPEGFIKDVSKWVIFPRTAYNAHVRIENRNHNVLPAELSAYKRNFVRGNGRKGIACGGVSYEYVMEYLSGFDLDEIGVKLLKISTPHPFPEQLAEEFLNSVDEVMAFEELDPVIEEALIFLSGKKHINVNIRGKLTGDIINAGENSVESVSESLSHYLGTPYAASETAKAPDLPIRPPVLCAGCPHRASFYAVKQAMKGKKAVFSGDIGCYTLGNAKPLDMCDTCLCMGADITIAQGLHIIEPDAVNFSFIGDSTFFASGMTGVVNSVYNGTDIILIVLDNSTTAMTGQQPNPNTGKTVMGEISPFIGIEGILKAMGVVSVETVNPFEQGAAIAAVKRAAELNGVKAIIFKAPCIAVSKPAAPLSVNDKCKACKKCIKEIGCPAIVSENGKVTIEKSLCTGCGLCRSVCAFDAIE